MPEGPDQIEDHALQAPRVPDLLAPDPWVPCRTSGQASILEVLHGEAWHHRVACRRRAFVALPWVLIQCMDHEVDIRCMDRHPGTRCMDRHLGTQCMDRRPGIQCMDHLPGIRCMDRRPAFRAIPIGAPIHISEVRTGLLMAWLCMALHHCTNMHITEANLGGTDVEIALGGIVHAAGPMGTAVGRIRRSMLEMVHLVIPCMRPQ